MAIDHQIQQYLQETFGGTASAASEQREDRRPPIGKGIEPPPINSSLGHNSAPSAVLLSTERPASGAYTEVTVRDWGEGVAEALTAWREPGYRRPSLGGNGGTRRGKRSRVEMSEEDLGRSVARSRQDVRRKLRAMKADNMCTATFRENVTDRALAWKAISRFIRRLEDQFGEFDYVCIPELQKRGAFHFHLALNRFLDVNLVRALWYQVLKGLKLWQVGAASPGAINMRYRWGRRHETKGMRVNRMIRYMAKYMTKEFDAANGMTNEKRYRSNVNAEASCVKTVFYVRSGTFDDVLIAGELMRLTGCGWISEPWYFYEAGTRYGLIALE